jgi:steroid Delta-isomerase
MLKDMFVEMAKGRETPTGERIRELVLRYLATFATGDIEARIALFAPDASFEDPVGTPPMIGHDALRAFFSQSGGMKISAELERIAICGNEAAFAFRARLDAGEGGQVTIHPFETLVMNDDGLIAQMRAYFDADAIS